MASWESMVGDRSVSTLHQSFILRFPPFSGPRQTGDPERRRPIGGEAFSPPPTVAHLQVGRPWRRQKPKTANIFG